MADEVGGLFSVGFDYKGFCADPDTRLGIEKLAGSVERHTTSPVNFDKLVIDGMVASLEAFLSGLVTTPVNPNGPLVVGADTPATRADAQNFMAYLESTQGTKFSEVVKDKVAGCPGLIKALQNKSDAYKAALLNSEWLDTVIAWVQKYGPTLVQLLLVFLPFII